MSPKTRTADNVIVRTSRLGDRQRVQQICKDTGLRGRPTRIFFEDEEVMSILGVDYYLDYEPESCLVAEFNGRIVGYAIAAKDTKHQSRVLLMRILPRVIGRILWKVITLQYRRKDTYRTLWYILSRSWRELPSSPIELHPTGHVHWNIDPEYAKSKVRAMKLGMKFCEAAIGHLREAGVRAIHGMIFEEEDDDSVTRLYARFYGGRVVAMKRFSLWERYTGKPWYAKAIVAEI